MKRLAVLLLLPLLVLGLASVANAATARPNITVYQNTCQLPSIHTITSSGYYQQVYLENDFCLYSTNNRYLITFQSDGNLVEYDQSSSPLKAIWSTGTAGHPYAYLDLQPDENLVIYNDNGAVLWATNAHNVSDYTLQNDGNFVGYDEYESEPGNVIHFIAEWASGK